MVIYYNSKQNCAPKERPYTVTMAYKTLFQSWRVLKILIASGWHITTTKYRLGNMERKTLCSDYLMQTRLLRYGDLRWFHSRWPCGRSSHHVINSIIRFYVKTYCKGEKCNAVYFWKKGTTYSMRNSISRDGEKVDFIVKKFVVSINNHYHTAF